MRTHGTASRRHRTGTVSCGQEEHPNHIRRRCDCVRVRSINIECVCGCRRSALGERVFLDFCRCGETRLTTVLKLGQRGNHSCNVCVAPAIFCRNQVLLSYLSMPHHSKSVLRSTHKNVDSEHFSTLPRHIFRPHLLSSCPFALFLPSVATALTAIGPSS